jgi:hypothetical protein
MLGRNKVKKMLGESKTELQQKLNKIVNQEVIDTQFSHTLQHHLKQEKKKEKIYPKDVFEGNGKCPCDNKKDNKKDKKKYNK